MKQFCDNGGLIEKRKVNDLCELKDYDIIINCSGLGARSLVKDPLVYPIRGQVVAVKPQQPIKAIYERHDQASPYIIPHHDYVLLGGTAERDCWSEVPDPDITRTVYDECINVMPSLKGAEVVDSWAGLRPARETVRLEVDMEMSRALETVSYIQVSSLVL